MFGIRLLSSFCTQSLLDVLADGAVVVGRDEDVAVDALPRDSRPCTFAK